MAITLFGNGQIMVQQVYAETTSKLSTSALIPADNTIPQITEGTQVLSVSITPKLATSFLNITPSISVNNENNDPQTIAVFRDSTANAVATFTNVSYGRSGCLTFTFRVPANNTNATTFTVRVGSQGGISYTNRASNSDFPAGVVSTIVVQEISG